MGESSSSTFHHSHSNASNQQQVSQSPSGSTVLHPQTHNQRSQPSSSSSSSAATAAPSAAAAAAAALATLNNDLTLDMSIHISPLTLANHHTHHGQHQAGYATQNSSASHHQSYPPAHTLCQQQSQQSQSQSSQSLSQPANNLSGLFQESHTYYYHHQSSNSGASHYQYATKSTDSTNPAQQYSFGYYSAAANPNSSIATAPATVSNQQAVIYSPEYSSMSRLHQQAAVGAPSITTPSTSNVATAAHIFFSLYSLAGQAGN